MKNIKKIMIALLGIVPVFASAQGTIVTLLDKILGWITQLTPIAFGIALLLFFWGLAKFMLEAGSTEGQVKGKNLMIWGVIAFFVMASIGGLVLFLQSSIGVNNNAPIDRPTFDFTN